MKDDISDLNTAEYPSTVLVVDDEIYVCDLVTEMLEMDGYRVFSTTAPREALKIIDNEQIDAVITDLVMGDISGVEVLRKAKEKYPDAVLILMTGQPTLENAITVLREGVFDYLIKPFTLETLRMTFYRGISKQKLQRENIHLKELINLHHISEIIGSKLELDEILKATIDTTLREFNCDAGAILIKNPNNNNLEIRSQQGLPDNFFKREYLEFSKHFMKLPILNNYANANMDKLPFNIGGVRSHISQPIVIDNDDFGQIHLMRINNPRQFGKNNLATLSLICSKVETAIERALLLENLEETYLSTISALANAVEARDKYTHDHTERTFITGEAIAKELGWSEDRIKALRMGAMLHDIGKIGVPDAILNKPGPLTDEEFEIMKTHPLLGAKIVENIPFLKPALSYILYHHERYDGKGYPYGLKGEEIPIEGRLLSVIDTVDAITSDRPYRKGRSIEVAIEELKAHSGTQFDPKIVNICIKVLPKLPAHLELESVAL